MTKSKYGDLIRKAREPESQETIQPANQIASEPDSQISESESQYANKPVDQRAVKPDSQSTRKPGNQIAREQEREVNLCVKVPESLRRHWAAESKREGVTMTEIIVQSLSDRFGKPN